jgi:hypothetical protein
MSGLPRGVLILADRSSPKTRPLVKLKVVTFGNGGAMRAPLWWV